MGSVLLSASSGLAFLILVAHLAANFGTRRSVAALTAVFSYGLLRGALVRGIAGSALAGAAPYAFGAQSAAVAGIPLQEPVGWAVGLLLAAGLGVGLIRRLGLDPAPAKVAAAGAVVLASLSLAIEGAAARAGWWTWSLPPSRPLPVPAIALVDWGFVAFDLLLPLALLGAGGSRKALLLGLSLFPIHFGSHLLPGPIATWLPVSVFDLVHVGLPTLVVIWATRERDAPLWPPRSTERLPLLPAMAAGIVALVTVLAGEGDALARLLPSAPFVALAGVAILPGFTARATSTSWTVPSSAVRSGAVLTALLLLLGIRVPFQLRTAEYRRCIERGTDRLAAGDAPAAEHQLRAAQAFRPDHPAARTLLALLRLRQGRRPEARAELEAALSLHPTSADALRLLASMELADGDRERGGRLAALGKRAHPHRAEFVYLGEVAEGRAGPGRPASTVSIDAARRAGGSGLSALASLAQSLRDDATAKACAEAGTRPLR